MGKMLGYMLTWTTYGSWLQGDRRGFVKDGKIIGECEKLKNINESQLQGEAVRLTDRQREIVKEAIINEAKALGQDVYAIAVCRNHVHLVLSYTEKALEDSAAIYKSSASKALKDNGWTGNVWSKGFDKRFCFEPEDLNSRVSYVERHHFK